MEGPQELTFSQAKKPDDVEKIARYNIDAFAEGVDFDWNVSEIKQEMKTGWLLFSAELNGDVVAAVFLKKEDKKLLSKHTAIKLGHQGSGHSHAIKEFVEQKAREFGSKEILHYCGIDNFRQYSLNESHGYVKTGNALGQLGEIVEWKKKLKT